MIIYIVICLEKFSLETSKSRLPHLKRNFFLYLSTICITASVSLIGHELINLSYSKRDAWLDISRSIEQDYTGVRLKPVVTGKFADDINLESKIIEPYNIGWSPIYSSTYLLGIKPDYIVTDKVLKSDLDCKDILLGDETDDFTQLCLAGVKRFIYLSRWLVYPKTYPGKEIKLFKLKWR